MHNLLIPLFNRFYWLLDRRLSVSDTTVKRWQKTMKRENVKAVCGATDVFSTIKIKVSNKSAKRNNVPVDADIWKMPNTGWYIISLGDLDLHQPNNIF